MRRILVSALVALTAAALAAPTSAGAGPGRQAQREYIVLYSEGASLAAARAGVAAAGGTLVRENQAVGVATVRSSRSDFASVAARSAAIAGVAGNRSIGSAPSGSGARQKPNQLEKLGRVRGASAAGKPTRALRAEPLAPLQLDMRQIDATARGSYKVERGERGVRVGIWTPVSTVPTRTWPPTSAAD